MAKEATCPFALMLRRILVTEKRGRLADIARAIGMDPENFYGRVSGRINFTPAEATRVLAAVADPRLADVLLANSPFLPIPRPAAAARDPACGALHLALASMAEISGAMREIVAAADTDPMPDHVVALVTARVAEAQRQLGALGLMARELHTRRPLGPPPHSPGGGGARIASAAPTRPRQQQRHEPH